MTLPEVNPEVNVNVTVDLKFYPFVCPYCGHNLQWGWNYCPWCGNSIEWIMSGSTHGGIRDNLDFTEDSDWERFMETSR